MNYKTLCACWAMSRFWKASDDNTLVALTLMIAASKPVEKDIMIKVILNLLAGQ